jgi:hypothetical protein
MGAICLKESAPVSATLKKTTIAVTHVVARCRDCIWMDDVYKSAEESAASHAAETGHTVSVERTQHWTYNPKKLKQEF